MSHTPAPDRHDIEAALTRPRTVAASAPGPAPDVTPAAEDDFTPEEIARSRRLRLAHFAALVEYAERVVWLTIILSSLIVLVA